MLFPCHQIQISGEDSRSQHFPISLVVENDRSRRFLLFVLVEFDAHGKANRSHVSIRALVPAIILEDYSPVVSLLVDV